MIFSSLPFLFFFLTILFFCYVCVPKKLKNFVLLIFSLVFYAWGGVRYLVLMLGSILLNYLVGLWLAPRTGASRKWVLGFGVGLNLAILGVFKYLNFAVDTVNHISALWQGPQIHLAQIILPVGISFYTFQAISYLIDLYRRDIQVQKNPLDLALYISFFPQLIAGPIVQYSQIQAELENRRVTAADFSYGVKRFCYGLGKKVLISNELAWTADRLFNQPTAYLSTPLAWLGIICYTFQIYYDFSGYSDMAIGLGRMFGFHFLENFNYPYLSASISEFWRRWHISLSSWFKNYLYIPLGGSRCSLPRTCRNLFLVFLATGIWHGANWQFLLWGMYYGVLVIAERLFLGKWLQKCRPLAHVYTLLAVMIGWVFFRADTLPQALQWLHILFVPTKGNGVLPLSRYLDGRLILALFAAIVLCGLLQRCKKLRQQLYSDQNSPVWETLVLTAILLLCTVQLVSGTYNPFIYYRF